MLQIVLSVGLALTGILAGWLNCFNNGKPTLIGWWMISSIVLLTAIASYQAISDDNAEMERMAVLQERIDTQTSISNEVKNQNTSLRVQVNQLSALTSDVRSIVQETLKLTGTEAKVRSEANDSVLIATASLEVGKYYKSTFPLSLFKQDDSPDTLVLPGHKLVLNAGSPFKVRSVRAKNGEVQYLVDFAISNTNTDLEMGGWQARIIKQKDLSRVQVEHSSYDEFENSDGS